MIEHHKTDGDEHIIIKDDKGKKHTFYNLKELIEYLDSFKMSFLPDNFSYEIKTKKEKNKKVA